MDIVMMVIINKENVPLLRRGLLLFALDKSYDVLLPLFLSTLLVSSKKFKTTFSLVLFALVVRVRLGRKRTARRPSLGGG